MIDYLEKGKQFVLDMIKRGPIAFFESIFGRPSSILFLGIDNAGKSTLLFKIKNDTINTLGPTSSVKPEVIQIGNMKVRVSDLGGHQAARLGWHTYFLNCDGIVFVVDLNDEKRFHMVKEAWDMLTSKLRSPGFRHVPIAVLFNKIDIVQKKHPGVSFDEMYTESLRERTGISASSGEDGLRVSVNYCSVLDHSVNDMDKGFMVAFKWLDMMIRTHPGKINS